MISMDDRDAWFDLISEQEFAEDLFINYYRDMECYDLLNETSTRTVTATPSSCCCPMRFMT